MGRDARLARALAVDNRGNRGRRVMAHNVCLECLAGDLRIQQVFDDWDRAQDLHRRNGPPAWARTTADCDRAMAAITNAEIDYVAGVLRRMHVPYSWCATVLVRVSFPVMRHNRHFPDDPWVLQVSAETYGLALGRKPPHDAEEIARNVRWWYRHLVKDPSDPIAQFAREYAESENRVTQCHSVVQIGIERAEYLLNSGHSPLMTSGSSLK